MNKVWMLYITFGVCGFPLGDFVCVLSIYSILHDSLCFPAKLKKGSSKSMTNWCRKAVLRCLAKLVDQRVIWDNVTLWSWWWVWYTNADIFNLMSLSHYSITLNSTDFVSAMQLEMTIRKISIKDTLGRVVACEKSQVLLSLFSFWPAELSWVVAQAAQSIRAAVLRAVKAPHCDGKGMASTSGSLVNGLFPYLLSNPPDLWRWELSVDEKAVMRCWHLHCTDGTAACTDVKGDEMLLLFSSNISFQV